MSMSTYVICRLCDSLSYVGDLCHTTAHRVRVNEREREYHDERRVRQKTSLQVFFVSYVSEATMTEPRMTISTDLSSLCALCVYDERVM